MKFNSTPFLLVFTVAALGLACCTPICATAQRAAVYNSGKGQEIDLNTFYNALNPYGFWENNATWGKVWVCNLPGFVPYYTGGNWVYTDAGWAWVSIYNWGWAPFHYGRWAFTSHWLWVPGYEWAPAWVSWRRGAGYYGWAPLGPGADLNGGFTPPNRWTFCRREHINSVDFADYCVAKGSNINIITNTTIISAIAVYNNTRFIAGPSRREVETYTKASIQVVAIYNATRPGGTVIKNNQLQIYRPTVRAIADKPQPPGRHAIYNPNRPMPIKGNADTTGKH